MLSVVLDITDTQYMVAIKVSLVEKWEGSSGEMAL